MTKRRQRDNYIFRYSSARTAAPVRALLQGVEESN